MYHIDVRHPAPVRLGQAQSTILGMPADAFVRVAMPILGGVLSAGALVYSMRAQHHASSALALSGVLVSSLVTAGQMYALERRVGGLP